LHLIGRTASPVYTNRRQETPLLLTEEARYAFMPGADCMTASGFKIGGDAPVPRPPDLVRADLICRSSIGVAAGTTCGGVINSQHR